MLFKGSQLASKTKVCSVKGFSQHQHCLCRVERTKTSSASSRILKQDKISQGKIDLPTMVLSPEQLRANDAALLARMAQNNEDRQSYATAGSSRASSATSSRFGSSTTPTQPSYSSASGSDGRSSVYNSAARNDPSTGRSSLPRPIRRTERTAHLVRVISFLGLLPTLGTVF